MMGLFKATNPFVWALVVAFGAALFLYANHSTIAARFGSTKAVAAEYSGLGHAPAITGIESPATLEW
jgi:hypothetical protein